MTDKEIFRQGSTTYYWSSVFFPPHVRDDVFRLYSFVRVADNFVDAVPQDRKSFERLARMWADVKAGRSLKGESVSVRATQNMHGVAVKYNFDLAWVDAFLAAMRSDLQRKTYKTLDDTIGYMYGSAEVIGLMMARVMGLPDEALPYAQMQGRAMQYINFIRDVREDIALGRCYFPKSELAKYGLARLTEKDVSKHPAAYREFVAGQLAYYNLWQGEANTGFRYIPYNLRVALRTAVDMYNWTGRQIAKDPFIVFEKKVKPSKVRVIGRALRRMIHA